MKDNYGSLRRRTRDSGWQWLTVGLIIGLMSALVVCVGLYALEELRFPALEDDTATEEAEVRVVPNETEVAAAGLQQQTAVAQQVEATVSALSSQQPALPSGDLMTHTPSEPVVAQPSLTPTNLPDLNETPAELAAPMDTPDSSGAGAAPNPTTDPASTTGGADVASVPLTTPASPATDSDQTTMLTQGTPQVGTPPVTTMEPLGLPQAASVPPELADIATVLVNIDGGTFMMGTTQEEALQAMDECALYEKVCDDFSWVQDSTPPHQVTVDPFQMELYEVTVAQYVAFLNWKGPNSHKTGCGGNPCAVTTTEQEGSYIAFDGTTYSVVNPTFFNDYPITFVTWHGADEYCKSLNRRLPTEAEWERAARGPQNFTYPWGFEFDTTRASSSISDPKGIVPVDSFDIALSPYGIYNMAGNVSEWVSDWYQANYYTEVMSAPQTNPTGPLGGTQKVLRGGSWDTIPLFLRTIHRMSDVPTNPTASFGFRCAANASGTLPSAPVPTTSGAGAGSTPMPGAPTLPGAPTNLPLPTNTPSGPTPTLAPQ